MFTSQTIKKILLSATALSLLAGCACLDKKDTDKESNWFVRQFEKDGKREAELATVAYSHGDFKKAQDEVNAALKANPRNQQALYVGALNAEKLGRYNRARQYYEDLIVINGNETTILGTPDGQPRKITEMAKSRLRMLAVKQSELLIENKDGSKTFNISKDAGCEQSKTTITKALKKKPSAPAKKQPEVGALFTAQEQNIISRFLTLKELAEKDLITKEEFLSRRQANVGGLLPLTKTPPATGIDAPVPSPDLIIERIEVLKDATENRAITPREFSAERDVIIEALLPPNPRTRMKPKAPSRNILGAAKDLRKLEVLYDLNLITSAEKAAEQKAIESYLGINSQPAASKPAAAPAAARTTVSTAPVNPTEMIVSAGMEEVLAPKGKTINTVERLETVETLSAPAAPVNPVVTEAETAAPAVAAPAPQNIVPNVSSPF